MIFLNRALCCMNGNSITQTKTYRYSYFLLTVSHVELELWGWYTTIAVIVLEVRYSLDRSQVHCGVNIA